MAKTQAGRRPRFVLFWGGVAAGKTTMRMGQCAEGFVHIDAAEIFAALSGDSEGAFPGVFEAELETVGSRLAAEALGAKKDIAMEVIGDDPSMLKALRDGLQSIGYSVKATCVTLPVEEALKRHQHACETDPTYVSAYFTQAFHYRWVLAAIESFKRQAEPTPLGRRGKCPQCGSRSVAKIQYGMPGWDPGLEQLEKAGRIVLGGCIVTGDDPNRHCNHCGHDWRSTQKAGRHDTGP